MKLCLHPAAERSLDAIRRYLVANGASASALDRLHGGFVAALHRVQRFPLSGQKLHDGSPHRQVLFAEHYRLVYVIHERRNELWVMSVMHTARVLRLPALPADLRE